MENTNRKQSGVVKFFNIKKGFGFICISTDHGKRDIFVHFSALSPSCNGSLSENQTVKFLIAKGKKGFEAQDVEPE